MRWLEFDCISVWAVSSNESRKRKSGCQILFVCSFEIHWHKKREIPISSTHTRNVYERRKQKKTTLFEYLTLHGYAPLSLMRMSKTANIWMTKWNGNKKDAKGWWRIGIYHFSLVVTSLHFIVIHFHYSVKQCYSLYMCVFAIGPFKHIVVATFNWGHDEWRTT